MKKKIFIGLICGFIAGIIDLIPMLIQKLTWDANFAALSMWMIIGLFITTSQIEINSSLKGILISVLCLIPSSFIIGWKEPYSLIPILIITIVLGSLLGFFIKRLTKKIISN